LELGYGPGWLIDFCGFLGSERAYRVSRHCRVVHFHEIGRLGRGEVIILEFLRDGEAFPELFVLLILLALSGPIDPIYTVALKLKCHFPMRLCMQPTWSECAAPESIGSSHPLNVYVPILVQGQSLCLDVPILVSEGDCQLWYLVHFGRNQVCHWNLKQ
jgi:hypothetical protein